MAFLLRVELPDVPGSLGALATALGGAGADIEAIEIVERQSSGRVVDDVLLELPPRLMPDALITACHKLEGVRVHWISRYNAGANLSMDLEAVETFTADPETCGRRAGQRHPGDVPYGLGDGAAQGGRQGRRDVEVAVGAQARARSAESWLAIRTAKVLPRSQRGTRPCSPRAPPRTARVTIRRGRRSPRRPEFLASEVARLGHMVSLAACVQTG